MAVKKINFLKTKIACGFGTYPDTPRLNVTRKMLHVTAKNGFLSQGKIKNQRKSNFLHGGKQNNSENCDLPLQGKD